jgi:hypothetical protein
MSEDNGSSVNTELPPAAPGVLRLVVDWDPVEQHSNVRFDSAEYKTWDMVMMVLDAAKRQAESIWRIQQAQVHAEAQTKRAMEAMQAGAKAQAEAAHIENQLRQKRKY